MYLIKLLLPVEEIKELREIWNELYGFDPLRGSLEVTAISLDVEVDIQIMGNKTVIVATSLLPKLDLLPEEIQEFKIINFNLYRRKLTDQEAKDQLARMLLLVELLG